MGLDMHHDRISILSDAHGEMGTRCLLCLNTSYGIVPAGMPLHTNEEGNFWHKDEYPAGPCTGLEESR